MRVVTKCLAVVLALACFNSSASFAPHAQTPDKLLTRVFEVLESTADETKKWDDKAIAARTQAQIADLIWEVNPDKAQAYLKAAWATATKVEEPKRERSTFVNPSLRNTVRRDVLLIARRRAPKLAADWVEEMVAESKPAERSERGTFDDRTARSAVLLQMADQVVADNPRAAAELLTESLRDGVSFNFQSVLLRVQKKDSALAETVFRAALARLRMAGMNDPDELLTLYSYLYTPGRVFGANSSDNRNQLQLAIGGPRVSVPASRKNPALARDFLELAADLLLTALPDPNNAQNAARSLISVTGTLLREITEQLPDKAALLRARAQQLDVEARFSNAPSERRADVPELRIGESKEDFNERRVDLLEQSAAKGRDVLTRDIGYANAAVATSVDRYQRGLDLAGKIDDQNLREGVQSWLIYRATLQLISSGNLDEAHQLNLKNDDAAQRAVCFVVGAQKLVDDKDTMRAGEWLREAGAIIRRSEPDEPLARITLGIVSTYGRFDTQSALEWLLYAVKLMRKAGPTSLNDDRPPSFKRITGITPISDVVRHTSGFSLQSAVRVFGSNQFEDVLYILNDITPPEARGLAVVTLCSNYLNTKELNRRQSRQ